MDDFARATLAVAVLAGLAVAVVAANGLADAGIGSVAQPRFTGARGTPQGGAVQELYFSNPVFSSELVETGTSANTTLLFLDQTKLAVGSNSKVVLDRFVYDPNAGTGQAALSFSKGVFRFVTGSMQNKDGFALKTPTATIAIRGTDLVISVDDSGAAQVAVMSGGITVTPCGGFKPAIGNTGQTVKVASDCADASVIEGTSVPNAPVIELATTNTGPSDKGTSDASGSSSGSSGSSDSSGSSGSSSGSSDSSASSSSSGSSTGATGSSGSTNGGGSGASSEGSSRAGSGGQGGGRGPNGGGDGG